MGASQWLSGKESTCHCRSHRRCGFDRWVGKIPCRRKWQPTPVFLSGEFRGQRSLVNYSPWGLKELDTTEWLTVSFLSSKQYALSLAACLSSTLFIRCKIRESLWESDNLHKITHSRIILYSLLSSWSTIALGWPKRSLGFSHEMLWKSQRELFGQPNSFRRI